MNKSRNKNIIDGHHIQFEFPAKIILGKNVMFSFSKEIKKFRCSLSLLIRELPQSDHKRR